MDHERLTPRAAASLPTGPRLALVEDSAPLRRNTVLSLESAGFDVQGFGQVEDFYRAASVQPFDIVLMDLGLPGEDGLSAIRHLSARERLGIIVITARGGLHDRDEAIAAGADHYMVKPIRHMDLVSAIDGLWRRLNRNEGQEAPAAWTLAPLLPALQTPGGEQLKLTQGEAVLLKTLAQWPRMTVEKDLLVEALFPGQREVSFHRVEVLVSRLRSKAKAHGVVLPLRSIFGKGLCFNAPIQIQGPG